MTYNRFGLVCDGPGCDEMIPAIYMSPRQAFMHANGYGWHRPVRKGRRMDLCPRCFESQKARKDFDVLPGQKVEP